MDLLVMLQQLELLPERRLLARQDGEDVLFLYRVVHRQVMTELFSCVEKRADGHAAGSLAGFAGVVEGIPCLAEVFMKHVHMLRHSIVHPKVFRGQLGQVLLLLLRRSSFCGLIAFWLALLRHLLKRLCHVPRMVRVSTGIREAATMEEGGRRRKSRASRSPEAREQKASDEQSKHGDVMVTFSERPVGSVKVIAEQRTAQSFLMSGNR